MKLQFRISEPEFLTFQLYTLTKSEHVQSRMKRGRIFATIMGVILTVNLFVTSANIAGAIMIAVCVAIYMMYPRYHKWRMKRNFIKYIRHNYQERFNQVEELEIHDKGVLSRNQSGEGEIPKAELTELVEIQDLFLLRMKNGASIILPKKDVSELEKLKSKLKKIGVPFRAELDWAY